MNLKAIPHGLSLAGLLVFGLSGCGGGSGGSSVVAPPAVLSLTGTAATGTALAFANVQIKDSSGNSPCVETAITTSGTGNFTCTLKANEVAPFFVLVTDPSGLFAPMVSVATTTPAAGTPLVVNATPLTTAIVAQAAGTDALSVFNSATISATNLVAAKTAVLAQLAPVLTAIGTPAGYDPFTTAITAASSAGLGNTADQVLDVVKISSTNGSLAVSTVDNPTPVALASATTAGTPLSAPTASVSALAQAAQVAATAINACFAVPVAQRVLGTDTTIASTAGGPAVTSLGSACQNIVSDAGNAGAALPFKHNGYSAGQFFYGMLNDSAMTGATFSVPEVVAYYAPDTTSSVPLETRARAVLNLRYIDANGNPGNVMTMAAQLTGSNTGGRATDWWLVGNQHDVDIDIRPQMRRQTQSGTAVTPSFPSRFQNGLQFRMNAVGPNTNAFDHVYVTGVGLPTTGVWLKKNTATINNQAATYFDLLTYRNATPGATGYTGTPCGGSQSYDCNVYWFSATQDVSGASATVLGTNSTNKRWTQPGDGGYDGAAQGSQPTKGAAYSVRFFSGSTEVTNLALTMRLKTDVIPATQGTALAWNSADTALSNFLNPAGTLNGAIASGTAVPINWKLNIAAPQVGSVNLWTNIGTQYGWDGSVTVGRGATSASLTTVFGIDALTSSPSHRAVLLNHRTLDGSARQDVYAAEF